MSVPTTQQLIETMLAQARKDEAEDNERWERLACGQDTEEAEESGRLAGYADGLAAALEVVKAPAFVHVVDVFDRMDGIYVFASHDDAVAFEDAVNGDDDSHGLRCRRTEEVVCSYEDALKLIVGEREDEDADRVAANDDPRGEADR